MSTIKKIFALIQATFADWQEDHAARLAAALAYYTTFSLVPTLVIVITLAGLFGRSGIVQEQILWQLESMLGREGRLFVENMLLTASKPASGLAATVIGVFTLLFGAMGVFGELQNSLNTIWEVRPKPLKGLGKNLKRLVLQRLLSFTMILGIGFLLLVSLVVNAAITALATYVNGILPLPAIVLHLLNFVVSLVIITLLFAMMFKILPDAKMAWRDVWLGAGITALLFTIGRVVIAQYLGTVGIGSAFGAAGSLVVILVWIYYSAQILFLGAEFTQVYANRYGTPIMPDKHALPLTDEKATGVRKPLSQTG